MRKPTNSRSAAMRAFVFLQFAAPPLIRMEDGYVILPSVRRCSKLLNMTSLRLNQHFLWLETQGYITNLSYVPGKRSCRMRLRRPTNDCGASA